MTIWTLIADPPHFALAQWFDEHIAKVGSLGMVPLVLQQGAELGDVWPWMRFCAVP